jgi:acyl carrier protein
MTTHVTAAPEVAGPIRDFILEHYLPGDPPESLRDDDLLLEGGVIDSGSIIDLVGFLESRFGIQVLDDELVVENFTAVDAIAAFVASKRNGP